VDFERTASELLRALRADRSQMEFARRLRFRSNVAHSWETGRNFPTAAQTLAIAKRVGVDVRSALRRFYRNPPAWLDRVDATSAAAVRHLLNDLRGRTPVVHVARVAGLSRFTVARALSGKSEPRLPEFLRLVEACSLRSLDLIAVLVDPAKLPSLADAWRKLEAARRAAYDEPWTLAVVRTLELLAYRACERHEPGWIAARLGIPREVELRCIALLEQSGQIRMQGAHYQIVAQSALDTRRDPQRAIALRRWWSERALERFGEGEHRVFSYNVFGVSERDYQRLRELHRAYFQELRAIVAASEPVERVVLANVQLVMLDSQDGVADAGVAR
jgi:DNA-binding phage protein